MPRFSQTSKTSPSSIASRDSLVARGFSLVELLAVLGISLVVISLLMPAASRGRSAARQVTALSRCRDLAVLVTFYAGDYRDAPPVLFKPAYTWGRDQRQEIVLDGHTIRGHWFNNAQFFHLALNPPPPAEAIRDPANPRRTSFEVHGVNTSAFSDFSIAECFYADPAFYQRATQVGPQQWAAQRLTSVQFPSQKGFLKQQTVYDRPGVVAGYPACCYAGVRSAVVWADLAATIEAQGELRIGAPNFWHHGLPGALPFWAHGAPIDSTIDGVRGTDR